MKQALEYLNNLSGYIDKADDSKSALQLSDEAYNAWLWIKTFRNAMPDRLQTHDIAEFVYGIDNDLEELQAYAHQLAERADKFAQDMEREESYSTWREEISKDFYDTRGVKTGRII